MRGNNSMIDLSEGYIGSSCVVKAKNNDLLIMGTLHRIKTSFIDISSTRNELPVISYNLFVKVEVYNARLGFRVLIGRVYISNQELIRIIDLNEATNDERREYFRISTRCDGIIFNLTHQQPDGTIKEYQDFKVSLVDISLGGLMFRTKEVLGVGETFSIVIPAMKENMLYECTIRRSVEKPENYIGYGCEFSEMTNLQEDILYRYILRCQNELLKRIR